VSSVRPCVSVPADLAALYRRHRGRLPTLSALLAGAMREALGALDVTLPPEPEPPRTAAATAKRWAKRPRRRKA
jgi:hypothetical protein